MVAGVNRWAGSTGDNGITVRSGKAARVLAVRFPSNNRAVRLGGVISPRCTSTGTSESPGDRGPRLPRADADNQSPLVVRLFPCGVSRLRR